MNDKGIPDQATRNAEKKEGLKERLWYKHDLDDVYFQRETFVTYLSILGGVAVGSLLTQFLPLVEQIQLGNWHFLLYFLASLCILISTWIVLAWLAITLKMQIRFLLIIPQFFLLFTLCVQCLLVTNPTGWLAASGFFLMFSLSNNVVLKKAGLWDRFSSTVNSSTKKTQVVYASLMVMAFAASLHLYWFPSTTNEIIWGVVALVGSILTMLKQHSDIEGERRAFGIP